MKKFSSEIELHGHIIDSLILTKVFDGIMDHGGSFEVLDIKIGQKRVSDAREYLNKIKNGKAMPALALKDNKTNVWEPVGEENLYAVVNGVSGFVVTDDGGYILVLCDKNGIAKTIVQGLSDEEKINIINLLKSDNIEEYDGEVSLPV